MKKSYRGWGFYISLIVVVVLVWFLPVSYTHLDVYKRQEKIQLVGFGTFEVSERAERTGRNPQIGKEMVIPASKAPKFKAGKALKDLINK